MNIHSQSIRTKLVALLLPPLVSLVALWIFALTLTYGSASNILATQTNFNQAGRPAEALTTDLQQERALSLVYLGGGRADPKPLNAQRAATDTAVATYRRLASSSAMRSAATAEGWQRINDTFQALDGLAAIRNQISVGQASETAAMAGYTSIIDSIFRLYPALRGIEEGNVGKDSRAVVALAQAREVLAQEDALLGGVAAAQRFAPGQATQLVQLIGEQRYLYQEAAPQLAAPARAAYGNVAEGKPALVLRSLEDKLVADARTGGPVPINMTQWDDAYSALVQQLRTVELNAGQDLINRGRPIAIAAFVRLAGAALLGLVAVLASILLSLRISRSLARRLVGLRESAQHLADVRLPDVVRRLRHGDDVDVAAEAPPLVNYGSDEIGDLARAYNAAQRTAVEAAVQEARLRQGLNEVFLNIARRSQTLLHRQLSVLDRMERRTTVPDELEDLFIIDHLATRMRRHAEDLVILAGSAPGRGWRNPVPVIDVLRGASGEVADYTRVDVFAIPDVMLVGRAVADVIHMFAELIENSTEFSPPHTRVTVTGQMVPNGLAVEIEDRGLGMPAEEIEEANGKLANPPNFDPADSARLGLLVVSLLANRNGIRVMLRRSPYGGITTVALLPPDLVVTREAIEAERAAAAAGAPVAATGAGGAGTAGATSTGPAGAPFTGTSGTATVAADPGTWVAPGDGDGTAGGGARTGRTGSLLALTSGGADGSRARGTAQPVAPRQRSATGGNGGGGAGDTTRTAVTATGGTGRTGNGVTGTGRTGNGVTRDGMVATGGNAAAGTSGPGDAVPEELTEDGLPIRRRQASLAPQLYADPPPPGAMAPLTMRPPEEARAMMRSFQAGLRRGRRDAAMLSTAPGSSAAPDSSEDPQRSADPGREA